MSVSADIESRIDILELASRYVTLKKTGANYKWLSPFKQEKTPSFVVSPAKNIAYCFATHRGGGPIKFLMEVENLEYREALEILAKEAGVELKTGYRERERDAGGDIYDLHKAAKDYYCRTLRKPEHADKLAYLLDRGLSMETIDRFELGFADGGKPHWTDLQSRGFGEKMLLESGIFSAPWRDKFTGRITFPLCNFTGHPVGFTGRIIGSGEPKYLNSPASQIFDKSSILYGLHLAKSEITKADKVVIVEGQMDTVALHQAGYRYAVGISGSALTRDQIRLLRRLTKNLYLCLDTDRAGVMATFASIENMINEDVNLSVIRVEGAKDPDEFLKAGGDFESLVRSAPSHIAFFIRHAGERHNIESITGKKAVVDELLPMLKRLQSPIELDLYVREICRELDLGSESVYEALGRYRIKPTAVVEPENENRAFGLTECLIGYLAEYGYFHLFWENFAYTVADLPESETTILLRRLLDAGDSYTQREDLDLDRIKSLALAIQEENADSNTETTETRFLSLVRSLNKSIFERERSRLIATMRDASNADPTSTMQAYESLLKKGKKLGFL